MEDSEFRFADCVLDVARRELRRADIRQPIEPKAFDLLHYLLRNRGRVVTHDELLAELWPDQPVKAGTLARAVMLARRAIGEVASRPLIQTSSRIGYRFVGEVATGAGQDRPLPLALLPFDNQTGDRQLDWVELGLMSLVARALAAEPRLDVASPAKVLSALESLPPEAPARERADTLRRLLGVQRVVAVTVVGEAPALTLRARWVGADDGGASQGELVAGASTGLTELAAGLARQLAEALLPGLPAARLGDEPGDPLADEAMARALQAVAEQRWPAAVNLMRIVLDTAPDNEGLQLELLRCQAALGEPAAQFAGQALLQRAVARGDVQLQARVEQALGRHALNRGAYADARAHLAHALELAGGHEPTGWLIQTLLWQSAAAMSQGHWADAKPPLDEAQELCESSGNRIDALACLTHRAVIAANQGDLGQSMVLSREVVQRSRELRLHRYLVDAACNLAEDYAAFGRLHESADVAQESVAAAASLPDHYHLGCGSAVLAQTCFHLRRADVSDRLLTRLTELGRGSDTSGTNVQWLPARAYHAAAHGNAADAATLLDLARRRFTERGEHAAEVELLPWWLLFVIRAGQFDEAESALAERDVPGMAVPSKAGLAYGRAALLHARGKHDEARQALTRLSSQDMPPWSALAGIDAAWLEIEAGDLQRARGRLDALGAWHEEHPVAQAVEARWHAARGEMNSARIFQRRFDAVVSAPAAHALSELGRSYEAAPDGKPPGLAAAPWLATLW
jgi:DNA-binding winged helix-turn-helix (wHTH) protein/tetratricopeptide (TPR) repeat protein